jgi:hypothetical protein
MSKQRLVGRIKPCYECGGIVGDGWELHYARLKMADNLFQFQCSLMDLNFPDGV